MIRTAVFAAVALAAAWPALAFERTSIPARGDESPHFLNFGSVAKLLPDGAVEPFRFGDAHTPKKDTIIVEIPKGKPAAYVDVTDPRQNPFMARPERKSPPAQ